MNKARLILVLSIISVLLCLFVTFSILNNRIEKNPDDAVGNNAGNLNNGGLFCESNGRVYFVNSQDNNCMYSMNTDETDIKRLTSMNTRHILSYGNFIYFYMDSFETSSQLTGLGQATNQYGIYRSKLDGDNQVCLVRDMAEDMQLCGSTIYYQLKQSNLTKLYKIGIDKSDNTLVSNMDINPSCYVNGKILYSNSEDSFYIHSIDTLNSDNDSITISESGYDPIYMDGYIYYMNVVDNYCLYRYNTLDGTSVKISNDRVDFFNMNSDYIFYAFSDKVNPSLKRMRLDGSDNIIIRKGVYNSISLTSDYLYFKAYGDDLTTYHMPVNSSSAPEVFNSVQ